MAAGGELAAELMFRKCNVLRGRNTTHARRNRHNRIVQSQ